MKRAELIARAKQFGIKPDSLRTKLYRQAQRQAAKLHKDPELDTFGLRLTASFADEVKLVRRRIRQIAKNLAAARVQTERLLRSRLPVPMAQLEQVEGLLLSLEDHVAKATPKSLCPYCKGLDKLQDDCRACAGTGLASLAQFNASPRRLREEPYAVVSEGKEVALSDFSRDPDDPFGM